MPDVSCRDFEISWVEIARHELQDTKELERLEAHLEVCDNCRSALETQIRLSAVARAVAVEASNLMAPPSVEQALLGVLEARIGFRKRRFRYGIAGGAIAALLALGWFTTQPSPPNRVTASPTRVEAVVTTNAPPPSPSPPKVVAKRRRPAGMRARAPEVPFVAIPYTLPLEPWERADVMRMDLPVSALMAAGLPTGVADPLARARADVLVGQDGRPRAVRVLSISIPN